jgi:hypothetical protein
MSKISVARDLASVIDSLVFGETMGERFDAQLKLRFHGAARIAVRPLFESFRRYIRELATGQRNPRDKHFTPFLQFHDGFAQIQFLLWAWYEDEPIVEILIEMLDDPDRHMRALAMIGLGAGNVMWKETPRVENYLRQQEQDPDALTRAASHFALDYIQFGKHVKQKTSPDMTMLQRLEQYAAQVTGGLARE